MFREVTRNGEQVWVDLPPPGPCRACGWATGWLPGWTGCATCGQMCRHWTCDTCTQAIPDPDHVHRVSRA